MSEASDRACPSCGAASAPPAQFCRECGAILPRGAPRSRPASLAEEPSLPLSPTPAPPPPRRGARRARMAAWIVAGVTAAAVAFFAAERERPSADRPPPPHEPVAAATPAAEATATVERPAPDAPTAGVSRGAETIDQPEPVSRLRPGWYHMRVRAPLFREPSETAPIVTLLPAGIRIRVTRVLPGFLAVESATGKPPGYVSTEDAAPED